MRADVAFDDRAGPRRPKQTAGSAGQAALGKILILGGGFRELLLSARRRNHEAVEPAEKDGLNQPTS
jgi:hypothetical protein